MLLVEAFYGIALLSLFLISTKSDMQSGIIRNRSLLLFSGIALALGIVYYGILAQDLFVDAILNLIVVVFVSILLFYTHAFGGGDCKLAVVMAMLFPAEYYFCFHDSSITLVFALGIAIFYGYVYLLVASISSLIQGKNKLSSKFIKSYLLSFAWSFASATIYIGAVNLLFQALAMNSISVSSWISTVLCIGVAWIVGRSEWLKQKIVMMIVLLADIVAGAYLGIIPFSVRPENYILVSILLFCQIMIRTNLYEEIEVESLTPGMILTTYSSLMMQGSRIRGLPEVSSEDLRNRLTQEEINSICRWAKSRGVSHVSVVKKIPFAVFVGLGYLSYFVLGRLIR